MNNNTRKYPRSTLEAFGCDAVSACAIERPRTNAIADYALAVVIGLGLCAALASWWLS